MNENNRRIKNSYSLFQKHDCITYASGHLEIDEDKMRFHIMNCLTALLLLQIEKDKAKDAMFRNVNTGELNGRHYRCELVKRKVFAEAISTIINAECNIDLNPILSPFPDDGILIHNRSWLPMHFAMSLSGGNKIIIEEDIHTLHAADPLAMHLFSEIDKNGRLAGCTPIHLLCMQKRPDILLVREFCLKDPKAFVLCNDSGKSAIHLVAQYSESLEVLQNVLQIDHTLTRKMVDSPFGGTKTSPLGLLCGRYEFPSFHEMFTCLIEVDRTVSVVLDGVFQSLLQWKDSSNQNILPGSRGERTVILLGKLLDANVDVINHIDSFIFHMACTCLRGELGIAVISLFLSKNSGGLKSTFMDGYLPIHRAVVHSSADVFKFLVKVYPESVSMVIAPHGDQGEGTSLLHFIQDSESSIADIKAIVEFLCALCPTLIHMKCEKGQTPLHRALLVEGKLKMDSVKLLCNIDNTVLRDTWTHSDRDGSLSLMLPLHILIFDYPPRSEISDEGDCFRLFLRLYPAAAGIRDGDSRTPYDYAVLESLSAYFLRLLLSADPTIDPVERHNLNFAARREGMFLAFRALSTNKKPTIWAKIRHEDRNLLAYVISYL
jgi:hypothetical protein